MKEQSYKSVWHAIEPTDADAKIMETKSKIMMAIEDDVKSMDITKEDIAKNLRISDSQLSDLMEGKITKFSLEELVRIAFDARISFGFYFLKGNNIEYN